MSKPRAPRRALPLGVELVTIRAFAAMLGETYPKVYKTHQRDHGAPRHVGQAPGNGLTVYVRVYALEALQAWWEHNRAMIKASRFKSERRKQTQESRA